MQSLRKAQLGVAQVWVHPAFRRCGVASALLDAARRRAIYAHTVPAAALAFSAPTAAGEALARAVTGRGAGSAEQGEEGVLLVYV